MLGSSFNCFVPFAVFMPITTWETVLVNPPTGFSVSTGDNSVTSPSYTCNSHQCVYSASGQVLSARPTSLVSLILRPIARLKFSINTSVFLISLENTSLPTIGQNGTYQNLGITLLLLHKLLITLLPSSWAMAKAMAVLPVPGGPAIRIARPAILFAWLKISSMLHKVNVSPWSDLPQVQQPLWPGLGQLDQRQPGFIQA